MITSDQIIKMLNDIHEECHKLPNTQCMHGEFMLALAEAFKQTPSYQMLSQETATSTMLAILEEDPERMIMAPAVAAWCRGFLMGMHYAKTEVKQVEELEKMWNRK